MLEMASGVFKYHTKTLLLSLLSVFDNGRCSYILLSLRFPAHGKYISPSCSVSYGSRSSVVIYVSKRIYCTRFLSNWVRTNSFNKNIYKTFPKPNYQISKTMNHIFVSILKPHQNRKTLCLLFYFMNFLVDYVLYYK